MKNSIILSIVNLLFKVLINRGFKNFYFELLDLFVVDLKYNTRTFVRKNNIKNNYVPYYTVIFKKNVQKLNKIISFKNTYFIDLGSGKGRILLSSSELEFEKIIGIEKDKKLFNECKKNITKNNLNKKIQLINEDFTKIKIKIPPKRNLIFFWYGSSSSCLLKKIIFNYKKKFKIKNIYFYIIPDKDVPNDKKIKTLYHFKDFKNDKTRNSKIITLK